MRKLYGDIINGAGRRVFKTDNEIITFNASMLNDKGKHDVILPNGKIIKVSKLTLTIRYKDGDALNGGYYNIKLVKDGEIIGIKQSKKNKNVAKKNKKTQNNKIYKLKI